MVSLEMKEWLCNDLIVILKSILLSPIYERTSQILLYIFNH